MARELAARVHVTGRLRAVTAVHVGGAGSDGIEADMVVARDGLDRPVIPGASLAGVLRAWSYRAVHRVGDAELEGAWRSLWGAPSFGLAPVRPGSDQDASLLIVEDAVAERADVSLELRDHTVIDAETGATRVRGKYDLLVVPPETVFSVGLVLEIPEDQETQSLETLLRAMVAGLEQRRIAVGAATSRGLGRVELHEPRTTREDLGTKAGVLAALAARGAAQKPAFAAHELPSRTDLLRDETVRITISWKPQRSIVVRDGARGDGVDSWPLTTAAATQNGEERRVLVLPGSSLKGVLRSCAERVARTVTDGRKLPCVAALFGEAASKEADTAGRGALAVPDCKSEQPIVRARWLGARTQATVGTTQAAVRRAGLGDAVGAVHVAIDRWTGSAADQRLYSVLEPRGVRWEPLCLEIDTRRLGDRVFVVGALVHLLMRELSDGYVPLGGLVTRGHGAIDVTGIEVEGGEMLGLATDGSWAPGPNTLKAWQAEIAEATAGEEEKP